MAMYHTLASTAADLNTPPDESFAEDDAPPPSTPPPSTSIDLPVFALNLRRRPDRRAHTLALLSAIGFAPIAFPPLIEAGDVDIAALLADGTLHPAAVAAISARWDKGPGAVRGFVPAELLLFSN